MKDTLAKLLHMHKMPTREEGLITNKLQVPLVTHAENHLPTAWERVQTARSSERLTALDYITEIFSDFEEMHGDRHDADDGSTVGGIAYLDGCPVTVIGQQKGRTTKENIIRNFGMPSPEGYRKASAPDEAGGEVPSPDYQLYRHAGAFPGMEAEEHGQERPLPQSL